MQSRDFFFPWENRWTAAVMSLLLTEAVYSLGIFSKSLNESCESKAVCFLTPSTALVFENTLYAGLYFLNFIRYNLQSSLFYFQYSKSL